MEGWFIVELMGHVKHVGYLTEVEQLGGKMGKIDAIQRDGSTVTKYFTAASVYQLTPTDEETCRALAKPYEYTAYRALPAHAEWCPHCEEQPCQCAGTVQEEAEDAFDSPESKETFRCGCAICFCYSQVHLDGEVCGDCRGGGHQG